MKTLKKVLSMVCVLCLLMNLLISNAAGYFHMDTEEMVISNRKPIITLTVGSGDGQVGYGGSESIGYEGPESFAVENEGIYVLDTLNQRIVVFKDGHYSEIKLTDCPEATHMRCQNGKLAVTDNISGVTAIYTTEGALLDVITHPKSVQEELVAKIAEIGDSYVIWETYLGNFYSYDWCAEKKSIQTRSASLWKTPDGDAICSTSSKGELISWPIDSENKAFNLLGIHDGALIYQQYEYVPNVDMFFVEMSVKKVLPNGDEIYAIIDFSEWKAAALEPIYLSSDGRVYVMECLEHETVISEIVFGTTDISRMSDLYQLAAKRRQEVQMAKSGANSAPTNNTPSHLSTRTLVQYRAQWMINYQWSVMANHKTKQSGNEHLITVPTYVMDTPINEGTNSRVTGIPYCWGGCHGYDTLIQNGDRYTSFGNVVSLTDKTAGNVCTTSGDWIEGTIGVDCVGFVMSAYRLSGEKQKAKTYKGYGEAVDIDRMMKMDVLVNDTHVMLYAGRHNGNYITYESNWEAGKTIAKERPYSDFDNGGYVATNLFCKNCIPDDMADELTITTSGHAYTCTICEGVMPEEPHNKNAPVMRTATTHRYRCTCDYMWPAEPHEFVNGVCTGCGKTE